MTPQEQQMIDGLIGRIRSTQLQNKDSAAEQYIQAGLAGTPDALYILVQTVLVQQYGLEQAQAQNDSLKQQVQALQQTRSTEPSQGGGSFLSHIFGGGGSSAPPARQDPSYQPVSYPTPPPPPYQQPGYSPAGLGGGYGGAGGGFLRSALQTAAGVAAGEMMFRGMEDLFSGFGGGQEHGFTGSGSETVINNYGDDASSARFGDANARDNSSFYNPGDDASRQDFAGNDAYNVGDDASSSNDDAFAGSDDTSSFDDSGNDDFSGGDNS